jgi:EcsC family protein
MVAYAVSPEVVQQVPESLWRRVLEEPERAPELIALSAADHFAPQAERWAAAQDGARTPAEAARTAVKKHVRLSRLEGAAGGLGGAFTALPDLAALAWIQGRMMFFVAAAHGFDPRHPMRPAELLTLQGVYPTAAEARAALDGVGTHMALQYVRSRRSDERLAAQLVKLVGRRAAKRAVLKAVPLLSSPISAVQNAAATSELGERALRYYAG